MYDNSDCGNSIGGSGLKLWKTWIWKRISYSILWTANKHMQFGELIPAQFCWNFIDIEFVFNSLVSLKLRISVGLSWKIVTHCRQDLFSTTSAVSQMLRQSSDEVSVFHGSQGSTNSIHDFSATIRLELSVLFSFRILLSPRREKKRGENSGFL